jgi:hypothetical protein
MGQKPAQKTPHLWAKFWAPPPPLLFSFFVSVFVGKN